MSKINLLPAPKTCLTRGRQNYGFLVRNHLDKSNPKAVRNWLAIIDIKGFEWKLLNCNPSTYVNVNKPLTYPATSNKTPRFVKLRQTKLLASYRPSGYAGLLSKMLSVTPERHSGFFAPAIRPASQAGQMNSASVHSHTIRLQSVYDGMTSQNKPIGEYAGRFLTTESESRHPNFSGYGDFSKLKNVKEA